MSQCRYPSVVGRNTWYCILDKAEHAGKPHHYGYEDAPQPAPAASGDERPPAWHEGYDAGYERGRLTALGDAGLRAVSGDEVALLRELERLVRVARDVERVHLSRPAEELLARLDAARRNARAR